MAEGHCRQRDKGHCRLVPDTQYGDRPYLLYVEPIVGPTVDGAETGSLFGVQVPGSPLSTAAGRPCSRDESSARHMRS